MQLLIVKVLGHVGDCGLGLRRGDVGCDVCIAVLCGRKEVRFLLF